MTGAGPLGGANPRGDEAGLTLVETMATLAILAVMAGAVMMAGFTGRDAAAAEAEARRLADQLRLAVDRSLVTGADTAFSWENDGYVFARPGADPVERDLPAGLMILAPGSARVGAGGFGAGFALAIEGGSRLWRVEFDGFAPHVTGEEG